MDVSNINNPYVILNLRHKKWASKTNTYRDSGINVKWDILPTDQKWTIELTQDDFLNGNVEVTLMDANPSASDIVIGEGEINLKRLVGIGVGANAVTEETILKLQNYPQHTGKAKVSFSLEVIAESPLSDNIIIQSGPVDTDFVEATLCIRKIEAKDMPNVEALLMQAAGDKNDPYATISFGDCKLESGDNFRTATLWDAGSCARWEMPKLYDSGWRMSVTKSQLVEEKLTIRIFDENRFTRDVLIGKADVSIAELAARGVNGGPVDFEASLVLDTGTNGPVRGKVAVTLFLLPSVKMTEKCHRDITKAVLRVSSIETQVTMKNWFGESLPYFRRNFNKRNWLLGKQDSATFVLQASFEDRYGFSRPSFPDKGKSRRTTFRHDNGHYLVLKQYNHVNNADKSKDKTKTGYVASVASISLSTATAKKTGLQWFSRCASYEACFKVNTDKFNHLLKKVEREGTITIFLSSPFNGCAEEREAFMQKRYPLLEQFCESKGIFVTVVDMRWGISYELGNNHKTVFTCLTAVDESDIFIGYFGARYGSSNYSAYKKDGRSWIDDDVDYVSNLPQFSYIAQYRDRSVTEMEFLHAFIHDDNYKKVDKPIPFIFYRDPKYDEIKKQEIQRAADTTDDESRKKQLSSETKWYATEDNSAIPAAQLKAKVVEVSKDEDYVALFDNYDSPEKGSDLMYCVSNTLIRSLLERLPVIENLSDEYKAHIAFARSRMRGFVSIDDDVMKDFEKHVLQSDPNGWNGPLVLTGDSGGGKSSFLANLIFRSCPKLDLVVFHFVGCTSESTSLKDLLIRVYCEISGIIEPYLKNLDWTIPPTHAIEENDLLQTILSFYYKEDQVPALNYPNLPRIVLVIDALNQITDSPYSSDIESNDIPSQFLWLPQYIPWKVRVVMSCLSGLFLDGLIERGAKIVTMPPVTLHKRKNMAELYLKKYFKMADKDIIDQLCEAPQSSNPMYLSRALDYFVRHGNFECIQNKEWRSEILRSKDIPELVLFTLGKAVDSLQINGEDSGDVVRKVLCLIQASRIGLTSKEIIELLKMWTRLGNDAAVSNGIDEIAWMQIQYSLAPFIMLRAGFFNFVHDFVRQAVDTLYYSSDNVHASQTTRKDVHMTLLLYFQVLVRSGKPTGRNASVEVSYHKKLAGVRPSIIVAVRVRPLSAIAAGGNVTSRVLDSLIHFYKTGRGVLEVNDNTFGDANCEITYKLTLNFRLINDTTETLSFDKHTKISWRDVHNWLQALHRPADSALPTFYTTATAYFPLLFDTIELQNRIPVQDSGGVSFGNGYTGGCCLMASEKSQFLSLATTEMERLRVLLTDGFSFMVFVKPKRFDGTNYSRIFDFNSGTSVFFILGFQGDSGRLTAHLTGTDFEHFEITAPDSIPVGEWSHVGLTLDNFNVTIYVNGFPVAYEKLPEPVSLAEVNPFENYWIGRSAFDSDSYFDGCLQHVAMFSTCISPLDMELAAFPRPSAPDYGLESAFYGVSETAKDEDKLLSMSPSKPCIVATGKRLTICEWQEKERDEVGDCTETSISKNTMKLNNMDTFSFDFIFNSSSDSYKYKGTQVQVFSSLREEIVRDALDGKNVSIMAYGQTGSGKSYTMFGSEDCPGLIPRVTRDIMNLLDEKQANDGWTWSAECTMVEIYKNKAFDLLRGENIRNTNKSEVKVSCLRPKPYVDDLSGNVTVEVTPAKFDISEEKPAINNPVVTRTTALSTQWDGAIKHMVRSERDIKMLLLSGNKYRATSSTGMNYMSSRSHCIFTIYIKQKETKTGQVLENKVHLVDLSGSEKATRAGLSHIEETKSINKSLSALNDCIHALSDPSVYHIPYRASLLTWFLQDSLGGASKTLFLATVSPCSSNRMESLRTLQYATFAKKIEFSKDEAARLKAELERSGPQEMLDGKKNSFVCSLCNIRSPMCDLMRMSCCDVKYADKLCRECLKHISYDFRGIDIGRCPLCNKFYSMQDEYPVHFELGTCTMCGQSRRELLETETDLCIPCVLGSTFAFQYECHKCHNIQRISHPMWIYQPSRLDFCKSSWYCHRGCDTWTQWRIIPQDADKVPLVFCFSEWGLRDLLLDEIRAARVKSRHKLRDVQNGQTTVDGEGNGADSHDDEQDEEDEETEEETDWEDVDESNA